MAEKKPRKSGRAELVEAIAAEKAAYFPTDFLDAMFAPFGKISPRKKKAGETDAEWSEKMKRAESPKEMGEDFAKYFWPRVPPEYRAFLLRRLKELAEAKERLDAKWARRFGVTRQQYRQMAERIEANHPGMTPVGFFNRLIELDEMVRAGNSLGAIVGFLGFALGKDAANEAIAQFLLDHVNSALASILHLVDSGNLSQAEAVEGIGNLAAMAAPHGFALRRGGGQLEFERMAA